MLLALVLVVAAAIAVPSAGAVGDAASQSTKGDAALRAMSDDQLGALAQQLSGDAERAGLQLLDAGEQQARVSQDRDRAALELQAWLTEAYKSRSAAPALELELLLGNGLSSASDGMQLIRAIGTHQSKVVSSLDEAEARVQVSSLQRAKLIRLLTTSQTRLDAVQAEQDRRADVVEERRVEREHKEAAKAAEAAALSAPLGGSLVAGGGFRAGGQTSAQQIDAYLASKSSPMVGQGAAFMQSGARWRVDPRLLVAIAGAESNFGAITCGPNNAWGWACPNDPADFGTWADGIDTVTSGLRRYYLDEGRTSVSLIQQKYCPVGAANDPTGLNNHWSTNVTRFLTELGGNPSNVGPGPMGGSVVPDIGGLGLLGER